MALHMQPEQRIPGTPLQRPLRCAQAQYLLACWWWLVTLLRTPRDGPIQGRTSSLPSTLTY